MFCHDIGSYENPVGAFNQNEIESVLEILVDGLHNWLVIELHFSVIPAVCYGVVKIATSIYWMFLHDIQ